MGKGRGGDSRSCFRVVGQGDLKNVGQSDLKNVDWLRFSYRWSLVWREVSAERLLVTGLKRNSNLSGHVTLLKPNEHITWSE